MAFPSRDAQLRAKYSITEEIYEKILVTQKGVCAICGNHQRYKRLAVDHSHKTGQVRGLLCENCNRGLGRFFDSTFRLRNAANYLEFKLPVTASVGMPISDGTVFDVTDAQNLTGFNIIKTTAGVAFNTVLHIQYYR